jgi:trigger factor
MSETSDLIVQSSVEETGPITRKITFTISADKVKQEIESQYAELKRSVAVKGFRKGKAPRSILERQYADQIEVEVKSQLLGQVFHTLIEKHDIQLVAEPQIEKAEILEDKSLVAEMVVEVRPEIEPKDYKGIDLEREPLNILDAAIDQRIDSIRQQHATTETVEDERPAQLGDVAQMDYLGKVDDVAFEGGTADDQELELGSNSFIPGFEDGLVGMKVGETKEIKVSFPENYQAEHLAGKAAVFTVTLKALKVKILPKLDDEFAKDLGGNFKTIDEVRARIRRDIDLAERNRLRRQDKKKVNEILLASNEVAAPPAVVQNQIKSMMENVGFQLQMSGMSKDQVEEMMKGSEDRYRDDAELEVKSGYLFDAIAGKENIEVSDDDYEARLVKIAEDTDRKVEAVRGIYEKGNSKDRLKDEILEDKVLDFLIENANVTWEDPVGKGSANEDESESASETTETEKDGETS